MMRDRSSDNVIDFPKAEAVRLEQAIRAFDRGDQTPSLREEFQLLARKGVREANYFLGCMSEDGTNGARRDAQTALRYYEQSIEDFGYVEGYLAAARLLYHGGEVEQDLRRAFRFYRLVAESHGHPVACFMLGRMYQRGEGTAKDLVAARLWYDKAISRGSVYGKLNLAMLEAEEGRLLKSLRMRLSAGLSAFFIARKDRRDARLRGG
jgi:hypothetical protein